MRFGFRGAIVVGAITGLLACGGGDDSPPATAAPTSVNADAVFSQVLAGASLTGLTATDAAGVRYTASLAYTSLSDDVFFGTAARRSLQTTTVGLVGGAPGIATVTVFYGTGSASLIGTVSGTGKTTIFSHAMDLPVSATVGQSGVFAEGTVYASQALGAPIGTETLSWSIEPDSGSTVLACLTSVSKSQGTVSTEKDCFRVDGAGNLSGGTISVERPGLVLQFRP